MAKMLSLLNTHCGAMLLCLCFMVLQLPSWAHESYNPGPFVPDLLIIPRPRFLEKREGYFALKETTSVVVGRQHLQTVRLLVEQLRKATGFAIPIDARDENEIEARQAFTNAIVMSVDSFRPADDHMGDEGYRLTLNKDVVAITAHTDAGLFYGTQTLLQMFPVEVFSETEVKDEIFRAQCADIDDAPEFRWRGFMLDVSRHFFNKNEIKRILDLMAMYKLNRFHWHLTDDQGWRIEIKKYPRLTQVGAWRTGINFGLGPTSSTAFGADGRYGGFYTQDDIREIVRYASDRMITVVPEIEMPGHSCAALMAYPELSCTGGPFSTDVGGGVFNGVYCAGNEQSFEFLQGVLGEVFELFPGAYVHIGGDEVPVSNWKKCLACQQRVKEQHLNNADELHGYFIRRMAKFLDQHQKTMIGWSEIGKDGLAPNAVLMDWIGGGAQAASSGHDVIMSPAKYCYLDHYQSSSVSEPKAQPGAVTLPVTYAFSPLPSVLKSQYVGQILGAQANLWTEYIGSLKQAEYMMFPRLCALAEVEWSPPGVRSFAGFTEALRVQRARFNLMGVNFHAVLPPEKPDGAVYPSSPH